MKVYNFVKAHGIPPILRGIKAESGSKQREVRKFIIKVLRRRAIPGYEAMHEEACILLSDETVMPTITSDTARSRVSDALQWLKEHKRLPVSSDTDKDAKATKNIIACVCVGGHYFADPHTPELIRLVATLKDENVRDFEIKVWVRYTRIMS